MTQQRSPWPTLERWSLVVLAAFTVASVAGFGYYALRPENLPPSGFALRFYTISFGFFAQVHILLAFLALSTVLVARAGGRWLPALVGVYLLSFMSEHVGTGYGIPFGGYEYTGLLGSRVGPRVPALIPVSWFLMAVPSWVIAKRLFPGKTSLAAIPVGALGLVLWDLALDPAMSFLTPYWRWEDAGPYYGMPWLNLVGWFVTGLGLMTVLHLTDARAGFDRLPLGWMGAFYATVVALPLGMLAVAGEWLGVGVTLASYAVVAVVLRWVSQPHDAVSESRATAVATS